MFKPFLYPNWPVSMGSSDLPRLPRAPLLHSPPFLPHALQCKTPARPPPHHTPTGPEPGEESCQAPERRVGAQLPPQSLLSSSAPNQISRQVPGRQGPERACLPACLICRLYLTQIRTWGHQGSWSDIWQGRWGPKVGIHFCSSGSLFQYPPSAPTH